MPVSLKVIPRELFNNDRNLKKIHFPKNCQTFSIAYSAFNECSSLPSIELPNSIRAIQDRAFYRCKQLKTIKLPSHLQHIGDYAFYFCGINELHLPNTLEYIGESAFFECKNLIHVELPHSVKYLGKWAFHGCNRLESLTLRHDPDFMDEWIINRAAYIRCYKGSKVDHYCQINDLKTEYLPGKVFYNILK